MPPRMLILHRGRMVVGFTSVEEYKKHKRRLSPTWGKVIGKKICSI